jgi:hypothetical protein
MQELSCFPILYFALAASDRGREFDDDNDACKFSRRLGDLVILGPTLANVNIFGRS